MKYQVPNVGEIEIKTIVLDLNGTLAINGKVPAGVKERLNKLREIDIKAILFTGDQRGNAKELCAELGIDLKIAKTGEDKERLFTELDSETTASIGNGRMDVGTFKLAKIAIATLQAEGIHTEILQFIDVIVPTINDALDFFIDSDILGATMRR